MIKDHANFDTKLRISLSINDYQKRCHNTSTAHKSNHKRKKSLNF